jgi:iron complex outermembrane receptor protein
MRAEWTDPSKRYTFALYGDNVTNQRYITQVANGNFGIAAIWNYPVTYGVSFRAKY